MQTAVPPRQPSRSRRAYQVVRRARAVFALAACVALMGSCQAGLVGSILLAVPGTAQ